VSADVSVVLELFDKRGGQPFDDEDRRLLAAASDLGGDLLRQAMSERQARRTLFGAVEAALKATEAFSNLNAAAPDAPPPTVVMDRLRQELRSDGAAVVDPDSSLRLAEAIRVLALRHGPAAVAHCVGLVDSVRRLLDEATGG
jgi:hypothetical protein